MSGAPSDGPPSEPASATSMHSSHGWEVLLRHKESTQPAAAAASPSSSPADRELWNLISQVEELAPALSSGVLSTAATRLQALAGAGGQEDDHFLPPRSLSCANACEPCASEEPAGHDAVQREQ